MALSNPTHADALPGQPDNQAERSTTPSSTDDEVLVLNKAKVEQLAYLLLDLVGSVPQGITVPPGSRKAESQIPYDLPPVSAQSADTGSLNSAFVSQDILEPSGRKLDPVSQTLLESKPWLRERIAIQVSAVPDGEGDDTQLDVEPRGKAPSERIPLNTARRPFQPFSVPRLQENSLYTLEANHAWTDLHTYLGPARFTEEGQHYWLSRQKNRRWPIVIPPEDRAQYLTQLWDAMTAQAPPPDPRYSITSEVDKKNHPSMVYKQAFARKFLRSFTFPHSKPPQTRKSGVISSITSNLYAVQRALFSTADPARARLPSTAYLRIVGQSLFANCLSTEQEGDAETSLRILIASLGVLNAKPLTKRQADDKAEPLETTASSQPQEIDTELDRSDTIWALLAACYSTKVLEQPPIGAEKELWDHVHRTLSALQLVNVFTRDLDKSFVQSFTFEELLSSSVMSLCPRITLRRREPVYPAGKHEYFGKKELNVTTLQNIGALNVLWTRYIDEHLSLDTHHSEVRIFWPAWVLANLPCASLFAPVPVSDVVKDLLSTYSFLFYSPSGFYGALSAYNKLDPPTWLGSMTTPLSELTKARPLVGDTRYHLALYGDVPTQAQWGSENTSMMRFDACGMFENRARILKVYMDSQKPSGLLALWRDKRDSGQWYTFWLVLIVGGISIVLATASLAVSIAQTVAAFQALPHGSANSSTSLNSSNSTGPSTAARSASAPVTLLAYLA